MAIVLIVIVAIIVMVVLGIAIVGLALKLLWWALVGLVIGSLARLVLPGAQPIGWLATIGAGIAGALLGGDRRDALGWGGVLELVLSIAAAAVLIAALGGTRRAHV